MFDLKKLVLISTLPIIGSSSMEIVSSITSCSGTFHSTDSTKTMRFSTQSIIKLTGDATLYTIAGIQDLEKKIFPVNIRGLQAVLHTKTNNRKFFAGQLFELSGYSKLIYPIPSSGKLEIVALNGFDKLQYSKTKDGNFTDVILNEKYSVNGFFQLPIDVNISNEDSKVDITVKSYFYDENLKTDYTDNRQRHITLVTNNELIDEYLNNGEESNYKFGRTMSESFNFCKDIDFKFIGCGLFNHIDNTIDSDKDGISDYDELYYGLNPNNIEDGSVDTDGDGMLNNKEIIFNTNLNDKNSF